jgi:hypothetical protein
MCIKGSGRDCGGVIRWNGGGKEGTDEVRIEVHFRNRTSGSARLVEITTATTYINI